MCACVPAVDDKDEAADGEVLEEEEEDEEEGGACCSRASGSAEP